MPTIPGGPLNCLNSLITNVLRNIFTNPRGRLQLQLLSLTHFFYIFLYSICIFLDPFSPILGVKLTTKCLKPPRYLLEDILCHKYSSHTGSHISQPAKCVLLVEKLLRKKTAHGWNKLTEQSPQTNMASWKCWRYILSVVIYSSQPFVSFWRGHYLFTYSIFVTLLSTKHQYHPLPWGHYQRTKERVAVNRWLVFDVGDLLF